MGNGYYLLHRGWFDSRVFADKVLCQRAAWIWLIEHAAWKPVTVRINGHSIELQRGQLSYSIRFLSKAWGWKKGRTERFINALKADNAIDTGGRTASGTASGTLTGTAGGTGRMVITICNYEKYQSFGNISGQQAGQERDSRRDKNGTNKKDIKTLNTKNHDPDGFRKDSGKEGQLVSATAIRRASSLANKAGVSGGYELGRELEGIFLGWIKEQPRYPDAAFLKWVPGYLAKANGGAA